MRILSWFSCGAASAVASKVAVERYGKQDDVQVCYCDTSASEHPDNARFLSDIERWIGVKILRLSHPKHKSVEDVWRAEKFIVGIHGASCTRVLKRQLREDYQRPGDKHVFGLTFDEAKRISDFERFHPDLDCLWILAKAGITKEDCYHVLSAAGIELPAMYKLGYNNNNCIGCCKGGKGYWNKIRRDFPEVFVERAKVQREIGCMFGGGKYRFWLDELDPDAGQDVPEPPIECGVACGHYSSLVEMAVAGQPLEPSMN